MSNGPTGSDSDVTAYMTPALTADEHHQNGSSADSRLDRLRSLWSYSDVLLLALAYLPDDVTKLRADSAQWQELISELRDKYQPVAPQLLGRVHFDKRPASPPYSAEVDEFFKRAALGGKLEAVNPAYQVFELSNETKADIKRSREQRLNEYLPMIREMSEHFRALAI